MPKAKRKLNPALKRVLLREFPDMEFGTVLRLLDLGLLNLRKVRCGAWSRNPRRPCGAHAISRGLCRNHGALSEGPSEEGRKRISEYQKARWAKWRAQHGRSSDTPRGTS